MSLRAAAIIVAAGRGERLGAAIPKCLVEVQGFPLFVWALRPFLRVAAIKQTIVVGPPGHLGKVQDALQAAGLAERVDAVVAGGQHRTDSVQAGLRRVGEDVSVVAIHDGARPLVTPELIVRCLRAAAKHGAAVACEPSLDTLKQAEPGTMKVTATLDRNIVWRAGTPQAFQTDIIRRAYAASRSLRDVTDDCMLVERLGVAPVIVPAKSPNPKVT
ncbi:MAG: 2-C-methyl-D-erythritol 4-phosphate cytidylyltransferase, partial [Armatimonadetes bacterium]|nr:2-C-methyl-D-erythritol 4-phosphate cytidylyltransferase [Armatimonadota bacterium]